MTEIRFYHLQKTSQNQVLPVLLNKILERDHHVVIKLYNDTEKEQMNEHLWSFNPNSFLPHGSEKDGKAEMQPIWLTTKDENPNKSDLLILCQGVTSEMQGDFDICCEMLDGNNPEAVTAARSRWKDYKEQGFDVTYWQQTQSGGWEKAA